MNDKVLAFLISIIVLPIVFYVVLNLVFNNGTSWFEIAILSIVNSIIFTIIVARSNKKKA